MNRSRRVLRRALFILLGVLLHAALSVLALMCALSTGLGPPHAGDPPVTRGQEIMSAVGNFILEILWLPIEIARKLFFTGRPLPGGDWLWVFATGLLYSMAALLLYVLLRAWRDKRRPDHNADQYLRL